MGKARKANKSLTAWVNFVKSVRDKYKLNYKDAISKAKQLKDKGADWMNTGLKSMKLKGGEPGDEYEEEPVEERPVEEGEMYGGRRHRRRTHKRRGSRARARGRSRAFKRTMSRRKSASRKASRSMGLVMGVA
jgi:hypothetical protein